jgi:hypothetical protein
MFSSGSGVPCHGWFTVHSCAPVSTDLRVVSAVYRGPKKKWKVKETVHRFKSARQARTGRNMVKSSSSIARSTSLIFRPLYLKTQSVPRSKHFSSYTKHRPLYLKTQSVPRSEHFSSYTKHRPLYSKTQYVPRSKHFSSRL